MFELDDRLAADTVPIGDLALCRVLLMNDVRYPWLILVPAKPDLTELGDLTRDDRILLSDEIDAVSAILNDLYNPLKLNVGALGNIVRQLHIHHIVRFEGDASFPKPVWGVGEAVPYDADALNETVSGLQIALDLL